MKTITLQLYTFDELSEEVQKEIIERERWNIMDQCMEAYGSDYVTSLRTFEKLTNTQSCSWSVNYSGYNFNFKYNNKFRNDIHIFDKIYHEFKNFNSINIEELFKDIYSFILENELEFKRMTSV